MSQMRKDPITGRWVIFSDARTKRAGDYSSTKEELSKVPYDEDCPFCAGNEEFSQPEIYRYQATGAGWDIRCVPNRYPALQVEGELNKRPDGIYDHMNGIGAHEIIIETPRHDLQLAELPTHLFAEVLNTYRLRIQDLQNDKRLRYMLVFKNHGKAAGQRIPHSHSQLIALPFVPSRVEREIENCWRHFQARDRFLFDDILWQELRDGSRIVDENEHFVAMCPYAARFPFEIWIMPKRHCAYFEQTSPELMPDLASTFRNSLQMLNAALEHPAYNFVLHTAPLNLDSHIQHKAQTYHWHFELIPKVTRIAGFEWGSGCYINPTLPEESASFLRRMNI